jgi:hypothetical protein
MTMRQGTIVDAHVDRSAQPHREQGGEAGSRDALDQEGKPVVFRDESAPGYRQGLGPDPLSRQHLCDQR